ncbi:hypothetical protein ACQZ2L_22615 [Pseudomonas shirazensis]
MADHTKHSFTAVVMANGCPINTLESISIGPVILDSPGSTPAYGIDGRRTLGMFNCTDGDWAHGEELGLITFQQGSAPTPWVFYFRHFEEGYRIYLRSGEHFGEGVFIGQDRQVEVRPITSRDPALWSLVDAQTGDKIDITQHQPDDLEVHLISDEGYPLEIHAMYPVGAFLACHATAGRGTLSLTIQRREENWLNPA